MVSRRPNARLKRQCAFPLHESAVSRIGLPGWFEVRLGKNQFWKKMAFYPHGTLVHFGSKKWRGQCCRHASPHRTPDWQAAPRAHFLIDQGGFFLRPRLGPFLKFMNSSIGGGTSGVSETHPGKDGFRKKTSFRVHRTHAYFADFFGWGPPVEFRRGCE